MFFRKKILKIFIVSVAVEHAFSFQHNQNSDRKASAKSYERDRTSEVRPALIDFSFSISNLYSNSL